jgi:hypothetical protein
MASKIISRLKITKQQVTVTDLAGNSQTGTISWYDDELFAVRAEDGSDVVLPMEGFASLKVHEGIDKPHGLPAE